MTQPANLPASQLNLGLEMSVPALFRGDIIATTGDALSSRAIGWATNGAYSHAILYLGGTARLAIDAMPDTGVAIDPATAKLVGCRTAAVFRHRTATKDQLDLACSWARSQAGKPYDYLSAAQAGIGRGTRARPLRYTPHGQVLVSMDWAQSPQREDLAFMCSELVLRAYEVAGLRLGSMPASLSSPALLRRTTALVYLGNLRLGPA